MTTTTTERGLCIACNYSLAGIDSTRCPECGRPFDPTDPHTMNMTGVIYAFERTWLAPARWLWPVCRLAVIVIVLHSALLCGMVDVPLLLLAVAFAGIAVVYLTRRLLRQVVIRRHALSRTMLAVDAPQIRKGRIAFLAATVLILLRVPFYIAFFVSLPWLHRIAVTEYELKPFDAPRPHNTMVGLFPVRNVRVDYCGTTFEMWLGHGLSYFPDGRFPYPWPNAMPVFPRWYYVTVD